MLFKTLWHKGCSSSRVLLKWNLEVEKKEKNPCPKFPFKSEVWNDIKQSTQRYCCRKVNSASTESKAISRGPITSSPTVNNKNPRRKGSTRGNGISHCPSSWLSLTSMGTAVSFLWVILKSMLHYWLPSFSSPGLLYITSGPILNRRKFKFTFPLSSKLECLFALICYLNN